MGAGDGCGGRRVDAVEVEPKQAVAGRTPASTTILQGRERARGRGASEVDAACCWEPNGGVPTPTEQLKPEEAERQGRLAQWCAASLQAAKGGRGGDQRESEERETAALRKRRE
jgi:hypothetical protein